jgi:signal transduction histidine kinase
MLNRLKLRLTIWFVCLSLVLYAAGGILAWVLFETGLSASLEDELNGLATEIRPSVEYIRNQPTLNRWSARARDETQIVTLQLFDAQGKLLERYGPAGVPYLASGPVALHTGKIVTRLRSKNYPLTHNRQILGYLQVQVPTKHHDDAMSQFEFTFLMMAPVLAVALGAAGYVYSGKAVQPVDKTLQVLRRFVADAGHEFNTPITVIEASLQTLEETLKENGIPTDVLDMISRASSRMKDLAASLILLARIESPDVELPKTTVNVREMLESSVQEFSGLSRSKEIQLQCGTLPNALVYANEESLRIMFNNLIQNAIRYTEPGGTVTVNGTASENELTIVVEDSGIGIDAGNLEHIFDRFYRADKSRSRAAGGSGLGLSIVKAIVEAHKGTIQAQSELGVGSKFTVTLPSKLLEVSPRLETVST